MRSGSGVPRSELEVEQVSVVGGKPEPDVRDRHPPAPSGPVTWRDTATYKGQFELPERWRFKQRYHVKAFTVPDDEVALGELLTRATKLDPEVDVSARERKFNENTGKFIVYLEWREIEYMDILEKPKTQ